MAKEEKKTLEVKMAYLQAAVSLPGLLNADATISKEKIRGLKHMEWTEHGLILTLEAGRALIPSANVKGLSLVD